MINFFQRRNGHANCNRKNPRKIWENFPNGIRNDYIDIGKILRLYSSKHEGEIISREFVMSVIHVNGIEFNGRFYFFVDNDIKNLARRFGETLEQCSIIYYSVFYKEHRDIFSLKNIFSPEVLKKILRANDLKHFYFDNFCLSNKMIRLDNEVAKFFKAADKSLSLEDLQKKLPFVPPEKILTVLSDTKKYLSTHAGKYFPLSKIQFDEEEIFAAKKNILFHIGKKDFADSADYDLTSNFALNPEVAPKNLLNIIYEKFFSDSFTKRGKKFFLKKNENQKLNRLRTKIN